MIPLFFHAFPCWLVLLMIPALLSLPTGFSSLSTPSQVWSSRSGRPSDRDSGACDLLKMHSQGKGVRKAGWVREGFSGKRWSNVEPASAWSHREFWNINCTSASDTTLKQEDKTGMHIISRWGGSCLGWYTPLEKGAVSLSQANLDSHGRQSTGSPKGIYMGLQECPLQGQIVFCMREKIQKTIHCEKFCLYCRSPEAFYLIKE